MAVPTTQRELLQAITVEYRRLRVELDSVPPARVRDRSMAGHVRGTRMSVADLVAYLIGWGELVLKWCRASDRGESADFPETGFRWNELGRLAQKFQADRAGLDWSTLLQQLEAVHERLRDRVRGLDDAALYGGPWYRQYTQGRMIQLNTSSPCANARTRLRRWKRDQDLDRGLSRP